MKFKTFINENKIDKIIKYAKTVSKEEFLNIAKSGKIGGETISDMLSYIDKNTKGRLNLPEIRKELEQAGFSNTFYLYKIDTKKLNIQDADIVKKDNNNFSDTKSKNPIVVGKDYFVIDGRHRSLDTKGYISAYLPADIFYNEIIKK